MNTLAVDLTESYAIEPAPAQTDALPSKWNRLLFAPVKFILGMLMVQSLLGGIMLIGWTYRLVQRSVWKSWWKRSPMRNPDTSFPQWAMTDPRFQKHSHWPNWLVDQNYFHAVRQSLDQGAAAGLKNIIGRMFQSLRANLVRGFQGILATWTLTLPGCLLMLFSWYAGWQNSFNKGYELAAVGPALGFGGMALFVASMYYVPLAQARQAVTGEWRCFFQFRLVWRIVREKWIGCLFIVGCYTLAMLPLVGILVGLYFTPAGNPDIEQFTDEQALAYLNRFFFNAAYYMLPAYVFLKWLAGKVYAAGVLQGIQSGRISANELEATEREIIETLQLEASQPPKIRNRFVKLTAWLASRTGRMVSGVLVFFLAFLMVAQVYVQQFLHYIPVRGWLNFPLLQIPVFRYVPDRLENFWFTNLLPAVGLLVLVGLLMLIHRTWRSFKGTIAN